MHLDSLIARMKKENIEAFIVMNPKNVRYLSGFTGEDSALVVTVNDIFFITDGRYVEQASNEIDSSIQITRWSSGLIDEIATIINNLNIKEVAVEGDYINFSDVQVMQKKFKVRIANKSDIIETIRAVKDNEEISYIREAVHIVDKTFLHILNFIRPGVSENEVATEMEYYMKKAGSEGVSFSTIVASGERSAFPHGEASDKIINLSDVVTLDFGALVNGYASDMTRTIAVGQPNEKMEEVYKIVLESEKAGIESICDGMKSSELDTIIRQPIRDKEMNQYFSHGAGHSIGLDIHEAPFISGKSNAVFKENMVMTNEPGIYLVGIGGIRIEDDILVKKGKSEVLTQSPKNDLIKLPFYK